MNKNRILAAVDIGSSKITTLIAQAPSEPVASDVSVNIIGVSSSNSRGVKKGQIVNIEESVEATIESVEAAERMAGYSLDRAFISVGGAHVSSQNSTGVVAVSTPDGEISFEDVGRVIEAARAISLPASREIIHVIPREYIVDGESGVRDPIGMSGVRLEVDTHIISASVPALKNLSKTIQEVGIQIEGMVFSGLASSYACLSNTEKELGCVLVDVGSGITSLAAYVDGSLSYSGAIPVGARNVTNDLAIGLRVSLETSEKIKILLSRETEKQEKDTSKDKKDSHIEISEEGSKEMKKIQKRTITEGIVRPRLNELFTIVKLDLEKAGILNKVPSGVVLTGGGALTYGAQESAKRILSLPVRVATPRNITGLTDDIIHPSFSTSVGLLIYAASKPQYGGDVSSPISKGLKQTGRGLFGKAINALKDLIP